MAKALSPVMYEKLLTVHESYKDSAYSQTYKQENTPLENSPLNGVRPRPSHMPDSVKLAQQDLQSVAEGYVVAEFEVDASGNVLPDTFRIVESQPERVFDKAVRRAVLGWRYAPTGSSYRIQQRFEFKLEK
ncbi:TonB family protein [Aliamphritea spongicola]|nr:TonB family protein [Aliamphritea spongicola]